MTLDLLNNLKIDIWYKGLVYLGGIVCIGAIFFEVKIFDNKNVFLFGLGLFLLGLGIWNSKKGRISFPNDIEQSDFMSKLMEKIAGIKLTGLIFIILGIVILSYSIYKIINYYFT